MSAYTRESCGCIHVAGPDEPTSPSDGWVYIEEPAVWLRPCELHMSYGLQQHDDGFDEGLSK